MPLNPIYGQHEVESFGTLSMLWQVSHVEHARQRRIMAPVFSDKSLMEQEPIITKYAALLMQRMRENAGKTVNLCSWFNYTTFDIIGDLTFGEPFDCLQESRLHPWISFVFSRLSLMLYSQIIATMGTLGAAVKLMIPSHIKHDFVKHVAFTKDKVDRRRQREMNRSDFMTHILEHTEKENGMSLSELYANSQILVMAGSETSATLLGVTAYHLMTNPDKLRKLAEEVRSAFSSEDEITFSSIPKLPYLIAVINESLRIHPPVPAGIHRFVPKGGAFIDGRYVPEGADVYITQWAAFHSKDNFADPYLFVPERWLGDERYADDNREVFQPFSLGPRNCIGRSLAYMESRLVIARMVWNFDLHLMPESENWLPQKTIVLYEKKPLYARLSTVHHPSV